MYMERNRSGYRVAKMAKWLQVSTSGYYAWRKRTPSQRDMDNAQYITLIREIHEKSRKVYGSRKITKELNQKSDKPVNHKRVEGLMRKSNIRSKTRRKYKATTDSKHNFPVAENILGRDFRADRPGQKMVSDITYIPTGEGWLYLAAVMDLCGDKIIGVSMNERMTKELTKTALMDAIGRSPVTEGCILHSDRGSQYCAHEYRAMAKGYGFIQSMSRKGDCYDNAPMESFFGKLKQEWLNDRHFRTRDEAKAAVFEYIWIFYNRKRIHAANGYITPEEYYNNRVTVLEAA